MKKLVKTLVIISAVMIASSLESLAKTPKQSGVIEKGAGEWYVGGNLHGTTIQKWHKGSYANRLATSADFVANGIQKGVLKNISIKNMADLKKYSIQLESCITAGTKKDKGKTIKNVDDAGVLCILTLGW